jgi:hypothetical protein
MANDGSIDPPRELTSDERDLLEYLISLVPRGREALMCQAASARVDGVCTCGCGTYDLIVDPAAPSAPPMDTPSSEAAGVGPDHPFDVLLFAQDGRLGCVEIVRWYEEDVLPAGLRLPRPSELKEIVWSEPTAGGVRRQLNP